MDGGKGYFRAKGGSFNSTMAAGNPNQRGNDRAASDKVSCVVGINKRDFFSSSLKGIVENFGLVLGAFEVGS